MNAIDKTTSSDISIGHMLEALAAAPDAPLVFVYGENRAKPGYHVTEVKAGQFAALDCGGNPEAWAEIFVQLWDVDENAREHMPAGKFSKIIRKVADHVRLEPDARLTFEVSDGVKPMALYCASAPRWLDGIFEVALVARPSSCKPRDRWLAEEQIRTQPGCCAPTSGDGCCGSRSPARP
jgi:hypothetical protein